MSKKSFEKGTTLDLRATFTDPNNNDAFVDPAVGPSITVKDPTAAAFTKTYPTDAEIIRESAGKFLYRLTLANKGTYHWRWAAGSNVAGIVISDECDSTREVDF